jgi:hypothetical protein
LQHRSVQKELCIYNVSKGVLETTQMAFKTTRTVAQDISKQQDFFYYKYIQGCKITDFTRPIEFGTTMNKVATRNPVEFGPRNDYMLLDATR